MLLVGGVMELFMVGSGYYYVEGVGYAGIVATLNGIITNALFLFLLSIAKWFVTCLTLGSGASGGIFSPSLFIGATFGTACGICLSALMPGLHINPAIFGIAGMAAMISGVTSAVFTGIIMVTELTNDHRVILPLIISSCLAYVVRRCLCPASIYTLKLNRRNQNVPQGLSSAYVEAKTLEECFNGNFVINEESLPHQDAVTVVHNQGKIQHVLKPNNKNKFTFHVVHAKTSVAEALKQMRHNLAEFILLHPENKKQHAKHVKGFISKNEILRIYEEHLKLQKPHND
jgi:CIC family chloride channel protein